METKRSDERLTGGALPSLVCSEGGTFDLKIRNQSGLRDQFALGTQYTDSCPGATPPEMSNRPEPDCRKPLKGQAAAQPLGTVRSKTEVEISNLPLPTPASLSSFKGTSSSPNVTSWTENTRDRKDRGHVLVSSLND